MNGRNSHKNILWIDDQHDNSAELPNYGKVEDDSTANSKKEFTQTEKDFIKECFNIEESTEEYIESNFKWIKNFPDAVFEIEINSDNYDLVLFDLDMTEGISSSSELENNSEKLIKLLNEKGIICEQDNDSEFGDWDSGESEQSKKSINNAVKAVLEKNCISCDIVENEGNRKELYKTAGIYLYLLLLAKGYPHDRIRILSNNLKEKTRKKLFSKIDIGNVVQEKNGKFNPEIDYFEGDSNSYYRIRRLVYQACEYWKNSIVSDGERSVSFNSVYKLKNDVQIMNQDFVEMLEHIEMLFPVKKPYNYEKVYYQAAKLICMFHEEKARIGEIKEPKIKRYHQVSRYFRNWASHNKLKETKMNEYQFSLLFCIALRTYFDKEQFINNEFSSEFYDYEKRFYSCFEPDKLSSVEEEFLVKYFKNKYINLDYKKIMERYSSKTFENIDSMFREYCGKGNPTSIDIEYIFLSALFNTSDIECKIEISLQGSKIESCIPNVSNDKKIVSLYKEIKDSNNSFYQLAFIEAYKIIAKKPNYK